MSEQAITHISQLMQQQQSQQNIMLKGFEAVLKQSENFSANLVKSNARRTFPLTLETFDGSQSLPQWIMDVELKAKVNQIPEEEFGLWARTALRGLAKQHIERLELTEWTEIKASLTHRFVPKNQNIVLRSKLLNLHENGSDISGYIQIIRNSNFGNNPRPFLNFSRNPPQNNFRYRQRKPQSNFGQSNSFSSFRSPNNQHFNLLIKLNSLADHDLCSLKISDGAPNSLTSIDR